MKTKLTPMQRVIAVAHYLECRDSSMSDREAATCIQGAMEYDGCYHDDDKDARIMSVLQQKYGVKDASLAFGPHIWHTVQASFGTGRIGNKRIDL